MKVLDPGTCPRRSASHSRGRWRGCGVSGWCPRAASWRGSRAGGQPRAPRRPARPRRRRPCGRRRRRGRPRRAVIVVDASAAVIGLLNHGDARSYLADEPFACPHLADSEIVHALRGQVRRGHVDAADAERALQTWTRLGMYRVPIAGLLDRIWSTRGAHCVRRYVRRGRRAARGAASDGRRAAGAGARACTIHRRTKLRLGARPPGHRGIRRRPRAAPRDRVRSSGAPLPRPAATIARLVDLVCKDDLASDDPHEPVAHLLPAALASRYAVEGSSRSSAQTRPVSSSTSRSAHSSSLSPGLALALRKLQSS